MAGEHIEIRVVAGARIKPVKPYRGLTSSTLQGGIGGWEEVDRPKRTAATIWGGKKPFRMILPVLFDGHIGRSVQEDDIGRLIRMALPPDEFLPPPRVKVSGGTPGDQYTWVIEDIDWDDNDVIWGFSKGVSVRYRQACTIHLLQFVPATVVRAGFSRLGTDAGRGKRRYVVKKGDTLPKIAVKMYHDRNKWKLIAQANDIQDPYHPKVGRKLIIP